MTLGAAALAVSGGLLAGASVVSAHSSAPTHGKTTCAIAGDECTAAIAYANKNDGGGAKVLAVEADTEAHGGSVKHRVFDIRVQTNNGVYVVHVYRNDTTRSDGVWWQSLAENQNPSGGGSGGSSVGASSGSGSSAPTHGKTTCAIAGDECQNAINYANNHDGGSVTVLAVEADTEAHGGSVKHGVFDVRVQTNKGVYVVHVYRNDTTRSDGVWWQSLAENQNPSGGGSNGNPPSSSDGSSNDTSPDTGSSSDQSSDTSPDQPSGPGSSAGSASDSPQISSGQAATDASNFATQQGLQVLGVKHSHLKSSGQKDYYQIKLQLGRGGRKHGTATVWVDASTSAGTVTAASGSGLRYRDQTVVSASTARANAVAAAGAGSAYKTQLHGGKWRWYWVFVRSGSTKYKIGVDAVTGAVTQVRRG
ncbi:MAG: hypothetical protein ACYCYK_00385 [Candidatus Dormibacteria bacterium]